MGGIQSGLAIGVASLAVGFAVMQGTTGEETANQRAAQMLEAIQAGSGVNIQVTRVERSALERWHVVRRAGTDKFEVFFNADTGAVHSVNRDLEARRYSKRGKVPASPPSGQNALARARACAGRLWNGTTHDESVDEKPFVDRAVPRQDDGTVSVTGRLTKWGWAYPPYRVKVTADLEEGQVLECLAFLSPPKFPASPPSQWVTRTVAVGAAFPGPPRWREGDWAELQWFEPNRGATCKFCWVLTRGREKVFVDAVDPNVLKRELYTGVLRNGG